MINIDKIPPIITKLTPEFEFGIHTDWFKLMVKLFLQAVHWLTALHCKQFAGHVAHVAVVESQPELQATQKVELLWIQQFWIALPYKHEPFIWR